MKIIIRNAAFLLLVFSVTAAFGQKTETPEERAKREDLARKNAAVAAENEKIVRENDAVASAFKSGNEALAARRYDEAVRQFTAGLAAAPGLPMPRLPRRVHRRSPLPHTEGTLCFPSVAPGPGAFPPFEPWFFVT
jgi:hypothetical protein